MKTKEEKRAKQKEWEIKNKEKRKEYLREYRLKNRKSIYKKHKEWLERTGKYYYRYNKERSKNYYKNNKVKFKNRYIKKEIILGTSGIGRKYEKIALELLPKSIDCNKDSFSGKWDIKWNDLKIDVKMRNYSDKYGWHFTTKKNPKAEYYLCFCVDADKIERIYFFPKEIFKESIDIKKSNTKYNQFFLKM